MATAKQTLNGVARRLGFEIRRKPAMPIPIARGRVRPDRRFAVGVIDGFRVEFDRRGKLRQYDSAAPGAVLIAVRFEPVQCDFRLTPAEYAHSSAVELVGLPGFRVETDAPQIVEKIFTMTRRRILARMFELWPIFEIRQNRLIIVVPNIDRDAEGLIDAIHLLVQAARAFTTDRYPARSV